MSFCFVFNITHYGWSSLQMNCLSFAVLKYISLLFVFTLRFCRRYVLFTSNESTQDSHSTSLMEAVVSCIVSSCLRNTPWCRVDIFLTPDTWAASALTVTSCYAAAWFIDEMNSWLLFHKVKCQKCRWIACGFFPDELLYVTRGLKWEMKRTIRDLSSLKELLQHPPFIVQLLSVYDDWQCLPGLTSLSSWSAALSRLEWCFLQGNHTVDA